MNPYRRNLSAMCALLVVLAGCQPQQESSVLTEDGLNLRFSEYGSGDIAILLVHGWSNDRNIWVEQVPYFQDKYRLIVLDLPGFGKSDYHRRDWSMEMYSRDLLSVIDQLELKKVILVGFSLGAAPCIEAATTELEAIKGLVIVDSINDPEEVFPEEEISTIVELLTSAIKNDGKDFDEKPNAYFQQRTIEARDLVVKMLSSRSNTERVGWRESATQFYRWNNQRKKPAIMELNLPVVGIYSSQNQPLVNEEAFKKYVRNFRIHYVPDSGHVVMWDMPDEFNQILDEFAKEIIGH